jgi:hypothetical protein
VLSGRTDQQSGAHDGEHDEDNNDKRCSDVEVA